MRNPRVPALLVLLTLAATGCYHQVVRTGATPGERVIERPWTATYVFGLVPASAINTAADCPAGVAVVETEQTFANGLVGFLTLGIYTPQSVTITCAAGGSARGSARSIELPADASTHERTEAIREALVLARSTGDRIVVRTNHD